MKKHLAILCSLLALSGCDSQPSAPQNWRLVGQLSDGLRIKFVELTPNKAQDRATYDSAVASLCDGQRICSVGFFLPGDKVPQSQSSSQFFGNGGWGQYSPTALWMSNKNSGAANYTKWDCDRAGVDGAPLDALCGKGVGDAYSAILAIAGRAGMAEACKWPKTDAPATVAAYVSSISDPKRKAHFQEVYDGMYASSKTGPDDISDCKRLRQKIEEAAKRAQKTDQI